jgi:anaerobic ribonucleoside-triphosphate reductase activating protein
LFKEKYPKKDIWIWTGFLYENVCNKEIFNYIDVLVDGQFDEELYDPRLKWRGSSNQRVIDIKKSIKRKKIFLYCD